MGKVENLKQVIFQALRGQGTDLSRERAAIEGMEAINSIIGERDDALDREHRLRIELSAAQGRVAVLEQFHREAQDDLARAMGERDHYRDACVRINERAGRMWQTYCEMFREVEAEMAEAKLKKAQEVFDAAPLVLEQQPEPTASIEDMARRLAPVPESVAA